MRDTNDRPPAPNYTGACIVMFGLNLVWVLTAIWVIWGLIGVGIAGWIVNQVIKRIDAARA